MHPILAIRAFFAVLLGRAIAVDILKALRLPAGAEDKPAVPEHPQERPGETWKEAETDALRERVRSLEAEIAGARREVEAARGRPEPEAVAAQLLAVLQADGRLIDFLFEEIESYSDEDVGAAVREVHRGCRKALHDHFKVVPVRSEEEEAHVTIPAGYDPSEVRLVGNVVGEPPFSGVLKHKGWRAEAVRLPRIPSGPGALVLTPAEVEVS